MDYLRNQGPSTARKSRRQSLQKPHQYSQVVEEVAFSVKVHGPLSIYESTMIKVLMFPEWMKKSTMLAIEAQKENTTYRQYLEKTSARYLEIESLASTHIKWFTHRNPYGCWICDLCQLTRYLLVALDNTSGLLEERSLSMAPVVEESSSSAGPTSDQGETLDKLTEG